MKGERVPRSFNSDVFLETSAEQFASRRIANVLGNNESLPAAETTIWEEDTIYVFPTSANLFTVESDDINDVLGGSGIERVQLTLLDANHESFIEDVDMNGTTPVVISKPAIRCNSVNILKDSDKDETNRKNAGIIRVREANDNILAHMRVGENRSDGTFFSVPRGKIAIIYFPSATVSSGTESDLFVLFRDGPKDPFFKRRIFSVFEGSIVTEINKPIINLPELGDFILNADKLIGVTPMITAGFQIVIMNKA